MQDKSLVVRAIGAGKAIVKGDYAIVALVAIAAVEWWLSSRFAELGDYLPYVRALVIAAGFAWFAPLVVIINWFVSYGGAETNDPEFHKIRKSLMMSFLLWLAVNALHVLLLNYRGWFDF